MLRPTSHDKQTYPETMKSVKFPPGRLHCSSVGFARRAVETQEAFRDPPEANDTLAAGAVAGSRAVLLLLLLLLAAALLFLLVHRPLPPLGPFSPGLSGALGGRAFDVAARLGAATCLLRSDVNKAGRPGFGPPQHPDGLPLRRKDRQQDFGKRPLQSCQGSRELMILRQGHVGGKRTGETAKSSPTPTQPALPRSPIQRKGTRGTFGRGGWPSRRPSPAKCIF